MTRINRANPDVLILVRRGLTAGGFDGLYSENFECACTVDDLAPCGQFNGDCVAGYRVEGCQPDCMTGGCDFHICLHKPAEEP